MKFLIPEWLAPPNIRAAVTLRGGGVSGPSGNDLNLGLKTGDDPQNVAENRRRVRQALELPAEPFWLKQVHGSRVVPALSETSHCEADASFVDRSGAVCVVMAADCMPVLFATKEGSKVAAAHAGWRGLAGGVLEATIATLAVAPGELLAWMGPAISQKHFEVGGEVREAFVSADPAAATAFVANPRGRWQADLFTLARQRLNRAGVTDVYGGGRCTFGEDREFFSYRRDPSGGRLAALIWRVD